MKRKPLRWGLALVLVAVLAAAWFWGYRKAQQWYAPLVLSPETVTYAMGETVPIGPEPNVIQPEELDGYAYRVNDWQLVDTDAFLREQQLSAPWEEEGLVPEKLILVSVTVINENNGLKEFSLYRLELRGPLVWTNRNTQLCAELNPGLENNAVFPAIGDEITVTIPFELHDWYFSPRHWRNLEDFDFYVTSNVTNENWEQRIVPLT